MSGPACRARILIREQDIAVARSMPGTAREIVRSMYGGRDLRPMRVSHREPSVEACHSRPRMPGSPPGSPGLVLPAIPVGLLASLAGAAAVLTLVASVAPSRRATRIVPVAALAAE